MRADEGPFLWQIDSLIDMLIVSIHTCERVSLVNACHCGGNGIDHQCGADGRELGIWINFCNPDYLLIFGGNSH